jgi:CheY-like chemotaxis protein
MNRPLILVVEDNAMLRRLIKLLADRFGVDADLVENGRQALTALHEARPYCLVLMDWQMPDMDGLECTRVIRTEEKQTGLRIPIVAITAHASDEDRRQCLDSGMDDYLVKPFNQEGFRRVLMRWVFSSSNTQSTKVRD